MRGYKLFHPSPSLLTTLEKGIRELTTTVTKTSLTKVNSRYFKLHRVFSISFEMSGDFSGLEF